MDGRTARGTWNPRFHKLSGIVGGISGAASFPSMDTGSSCVSQNRQYDDDELHKQTRWPTVPSVAQVGARSSDLVRLSSTVTQGNARSGCTERRSGSVVQRDVPLRGLVPTCGDSGSDLGSLRGAPDRSVRLAGRREVSVVFLGERDGASGSGCVSAQLAQGSTVRFSPVISDISHPREGEERGSNSITDRPGVGAVGVRDNASPIRSPVAATVTQGYADAGRGPNISSPSRARSSMGLARERLNLSTEGLPQSVINTIQSARAQSTRSLYDVKWRVFEEWCEDSHITSFQASVKDILSFLQSLMDKGRAFSTIKVYLAAISACHIGFGNKTVGEHPLICRFMKGARRVLRVSKSVVPTWDLALVLDALTGAPFEPLEQVDMKFLSLKTALLLALVTTKRVSDLHALSVHSECTQFSDGKVTIRPNPAFVPKNPWVQCNPVELEEFHPPPFGSQEDRRLHSLCPVRVLRVYMDRSRTLRKSDQLFVSWAARMIGAPITKQRLSHWIVEAIQLAYSSKGMQPPGALRAHSTRGMAASWALFKGVSIQDLCTAASWSSPLTFARFYSLDVTAPPVARAVLSVASGSV